MFRRALLAAAIAMTVALAGSAAIAGPTVADVFVTETGDRLAPISCTIRNTGSGWFILDTSGHTPSNCVSVVQAADHVEVYYGFTAAAVGSLIVDPDETFAPLYRAGGSVGYDHVNIYMFTATGTTRLDPATVHNAIGNWWIQGLMRLEPLPG